MKKSENSIFFPILLNLQKFPCLVVGGGIVAFRKVQSLLLFNAKITVISPKIFKPLKKLEIENKINIILQSYSKEYIKKYKIAFCATDNKLLNEQIHKDCKKEGILLNVADNPSLCDFILPANVKRGALTISISSQGTAPFMVKELKKKSELTFSPAYNDIMELAGDFRKKVLNDKKFKSHRNRTRAFNKFIMTDWELMLANDGKENTYKYMQGILNNFN